LLWFPLTFPNSFQIKGDTDQILICTAENESKRDNFSYTWAKGDELISVKHTNELIESVEPYGSLLRIINAEASARYTCIVANNAGKCLVLHDVVVSDGHD
jgi:hypothetical protein